jgi:hypothetical protein
MGRVVWTRMAMASRSRGPTQRGRFSVETVTATAGRARLAQTGEAQAAARRCSGAGRCPSQVLEVYSRGVGGPHFSPCKALLLQAIKTDAERPRGLHEDAWCRSPRLETRRDREA